jgi:hypothetical protein
MFSSGSSESIPERTFIVTGSRFPKRSELLPKEDLLLGQDVALGNALEKARDQIVDYIHEQKLGSDWKPDVTFILRHMLADLREDEVTGKDQKGETKEFTIADRFRAVEETRTINDEESRRVWIKVAINAENWKLIQKEIRQAEEDKRLSLMRVRRDFLARILIGVVVLFATISGYLRLDEWSKGYYTKWLRLAAIGCIGAVTVFLWFLVAR